MRIPVTEHESREWRELDVETGTLHPLAPPPDTTSPRGCFQELGPLTFVFYRIGTRLHVRANDRDVELAPNVTLAREVGPIEDELVVSREGREVLRARYPTQRDRMTNDSFLDPYEDESDFDLVLFAVEVARDEERRRWTFASEEE